VSSIAEEKEGRSIYAEICSETEGEGATSDTSVNVSEQQSENTASSDPALWPFTNKNLQSFWVEKGPSVCQNKQWSFIKSARVYTVGDKNTETRHLTEAMFKRQLSNGDCRSSMAYLFAVTGKIILFCVQIIFAY
jgi:hypothetical protein